MAEGADGSCSQAGQGPDPASGVRSAVAGGSRSVAAAGDLGIALSGDGGQVIVHGDVLVGERSRGGRSGYLLEVREMRAHRFEGRADELAATAAFATAPEGEAGGYWRWLAPAWTGKTALMAEFVLSPPERVDVLAFFITARMAGRADRTAFLDALGGQLRGYLREGDVECATQGAFLDGLERAAAQARAAGRRIVLVVDGLDEDTGVRTGSSGHSIAALLPRTPPPGLRIIVAGRPNPPVPGDVPRSHPLRDPGIDHPLATSPAARAMREDAERSLEAMLDAGGLGRELVALTAAAGGGLSAADLAELAGDSRRRVELALSGVIGRSFQRRPAQWAKDTDGRPLSLYSFAHQELLDGARDILSPAALAEQRARVHAYVAGAREAGWPPETPEYALAGYPQLLRELRDTGRLEALALDQARHERLWQTTGTDSQALTEIADAMELHRAVEDPDVAACVRLAYRRDRVWEKAASVPVGVILTWAQLGQVRRALAATGHRRGEFDLPKLLGGIASTVGDDTAAVAQIVTAARSIVEPVTRLYAVADVAERLASTGDEKQARHLAHEVVDLADTFKSRPWQVDALTVAARALEATGQRQDAAQFMERAVALSLGAAEPEERDSSLSSVVSGLAEAGVRTQDAHLTQRSIGLAQSVLAPGVRSRTLAHIALVFARKGRHKESSHLIQQATDLAHTLAGRQERDLALALVSRALAANGQYDEARTTVQAIDEPRQQAFSLVAITRSLAEKGRYDDALQLVRALSLPEERGEGLGAVAYELAKSGEREPAVWLAEQALDITRTQTDSPGRRAWALSLIASHLSGAGCRARALQFARQAADVVHSIDAPHRQSSTLHDLATAWIAVGEHERVTELAQDAADLCHAAIPRQDAWKLAAAARTFIAVERYAEAIALVQPITDPQWQVRALGPVVEALSGAGLHAEAIELAQRAFDSREAHADADHRAQASIVLVNAWALAGQVRDALRVAHDIDRPQERAESLANVARILATAGDQERAAPVIREALEAIRSVDRPTYAALAQAVVVEALMRNGQPDEALRLARSITGHLVNQAQALARVAAGYGPTHQGRALLAEALTIGAPLPMAAEIARVSPTALEELARCVEAEVVHPESPEKGIPQAE
ncbi:hypothetical protein [Streptomyces youssoufiensis]